MNITIEDQIKWAKESLAMLEGTNMKLVREVRMKPSDAKIQIDKQKAVVRTLQGIADKKGSQVNLFDDNLKS